MIEMENELLERAIKTWGVEPQLLMVIEELAELSAEISTILLKIRESKLSERDCIRDVIVKELNQFLTINQLTKIKCKYLRDNRFYNNSLQKKEFIKNYIDRNELSMLSIIDEVADVEIMLAQLKEMANIHGEVKERIHYKFNRIEKRLDKIGN